LHIQVDAVGEELVGVDGRELEVLMDVVDVAFFRLVLHSPAVQRRQGPSVIVLPHKSTDQQ
jgi:hypothetical protein